MIKVLPAGLMPAALMLPNAQARAQAICAKNDIRLVNSMREIAQPYHANLDKGGRLFAKWAGLKSNYVLQLNQGDRTSNSH